MNIFIENPTKARITNISPQEIEILQKLLTYTNSSVFFQIKKFKQLNWLKNKDPAAFEQRLSELQGKLHRSLLEKDGHGNLYIRPGSIDLIEKNKKLFGDINVVNQIRYPDLKPIPWKTPLKLIPYDYQTKSVQELLKIRHGNISLCTGAGKSLILLLLAKNMGLKTVVVTPSKSIFNELLASFQKTLGKQYVGGYGDGKKDIGKLITISIGKSLTMLRKDTKAYVFFANKDLLLVDESHCFAAEQLEKVCHGVLANAKYRFFVSATQTRNDGTEKLLGSIIGKTVVSLEIGEAIKNKYLCPLDFCVVRTKSTNARRFEDPLKTKREHFLYNKEIANLSAKIANHAWTSKQESTLILVEELCQIQLLKDLLKVPFGYIHSSSAREAALYGLKRVNLQEELDKFNKGEIRVIIGTKAISTGTNIYPTHNTINWMGGSSEIVTKQGAMGRSTRKLDISEYAALHKEKNRSLIFDFDVENISLLQRHLKKRIEFYKEANKNIKTL